MNQTKHCGNNNKDEDNSPKTLNDKNQQTSSQKFRQLMNQVQILDPPQISQWYLHQKNKFYKVWLEDILILVLNKTISCYLLIGLVGWVFANGLGDLGSILGRVIPKNLEMVLDSSLLNTQQYKVHIKGQVEQSRERSSALPYTLV